MDKKQLAEMLDGRQYRCEITPREIEIAKENGLVVLFGYSDDNMEFEGAIRDEVGCYNGGYARLKDGDIFQNECDSGDDCPYYKENCESIKKIEAKWGEGEYSWVYVTNIPHETFDIYEDEEKYCRGIVFDLKDI